MQELSHPWLRGAGVAIAAIAVFMLDSNNPGQLHQLWLPLILALCAYLMTRTVMAVAIAVFALAAVNTDLSAGWIQARAYPLVTLVSFAVAAGIAIKRFRQHIAATHEARWAEREARQAAQEDKMTERR